MYKVTIRKNQHIKVYYSIFRRNLTQIVMSSHNYAINRIAFRDLNVILAVSSTFFFHAVLE